MDYQYNDTLSWTRGLHNLKFGVTVFAPCVISSRMSLARVAT
jgi:hypothetical protein